MRAPTILSALSCLVVASALVTSCAGEDEEPSTSPASSPSSAAPSSAPPSSEEPAADPPGQDPSGAYDLVLQDATVVDHRGHDRLVLRFAGTGRPGWAARYVDEAVLDGSGRVVDLEGEAVLQLDVSGTPTVPGGDATVRSEPGREVVDVYAVGAFEGVTQVFVGLRDGGSDYRVSTLTDPTRLVVDLR